MGADNTYGEENFNPDRDKELQLELDEDYQVEAGNTAISCFTWIVIVVIAIIVGLILLIL